MKKYILLLFLALACLLTAYLFRSGYFKKTIKTTSISEPASTIDVYRGVVWPLLNVEIKDTGLISFFKNQISIISSDTLLVFRYNRPDCMSCMEFIYTLSINCQKSFKNVVIISNVENPRAVKLFEKEIINIVPFYNNENIHTLPFEKVSNAYIFIYTGGNNMASCFFIPERENGRYNEKMILAMLGKL